MVQAGGYKKPGIAGYYCKNFRNLNLKLALRFLLVFISIMTFFGCGVKDTTEAKEDSRGEPRTPVTVTTITYSSMQDFIELSATSAYLQKNYVKSNLTGYIKSAYIRYASFVKAGQVLFTLKTKESGAIGNTINKLDPGFKFSGINTVRAAQGGYVSELNHQAGDYVQDGEQLAVISNVNSFAFVMNVPYENRQYVVNGKDVDVVLPDDERVKGIVQTSMPFMDSV